LPVSLAINNEVGMQKRTLKITHKNPISKETKNDDEISVRFIYLKGSENE
jgi:hypothetical protein